MSLTTQDHADELLGVYRSGRPVAPPSERGALSVEQAYKVQLRQVEVWTSEGRTIAGHKVGLTSAAMQRMLRVDQPDYGHLMTDMIHADHAAIDASSFLQPKVEPEIGIILDRPLAGPGITFAEVLDSVAYVVPALEIIDSRVEDWRISLVDTIADNASSGGVVLGSHPVPVGHTDLRLVGCNLFVNGSLVHTGAGGAVLGSPLKAVAWLANVLGEHDVVLEAGHVVLPGSCTAAVAVSAGDTVVAEFGGGLGTVSCSLR